MIDGLLIRIARYGAEWIAHTEGDPSAWELGKTPDEAREKFIRMRAENYGLDTEADEFLVVIPLQSSTQNIK